MWADSPPVLKLLVVIVHGISLQQLELIIHDNVLWISNHSFKFCFRGERDVQHKPPTILKVWTQPPLYPVEPQPALRCMSGPGGSRIAWTRACLGLHRLWALNQAPGAAASNWGPADSTTVTATCRCLFSIAQQVISRYLSNLTNQASWKHDTESLTTYCAKYLQSCPTLCDPMDCSSPGSRVHRILQADTGVGCHFLFQGIFLTQGSNPCLLCLLHWQAGSLPLVPPGRLNHFWIAIAQLEES